MITTPFIEGVNYYLNDGRIVMTELYHKIRGYCCGKECIQCPFDQKGGKRTAEIKQSESED